MKRSEFIRSWSRRSKRINIQTKENSRLDRHGTTSVSSSDHSTLFSRTNRCPVDDSKRERERPCRSARRPRATAYLVFATRQHRQDTEANGIDTQRRRPIVSEDRETDVTIGIDMWMQRNVRADERHLRRIEWILIGEFELQLKVFAVVQGARCSVDVDANSAKRRARWFERKTASSSSYFRISEPSSTTRLATEKRERRPAERRRGDLHARRGIFSE